MHNLNKHYIRVSIELLVTLLFSWLYIPHLICYLLCNKRKINADLKRWENKTYFHLPLVPLLLYKLHYDPYFRTIFYFRIGPALKLLIGWYRPGSSTFMIPPSLKMGGGIYAPHAYSTILNANSIGDNFTCIQCTTLGKEKEGRPTIGSNVELGANVVIVGDVMIEDNVTIGAGSVVVKNVPANTVAAGVPAKVIRNKIM